MDQYRIMELLQEAVSADYQRRDSILVELSNETDARKSDDGDKPMSGALVVFQALYVQFCRHQPKMLPYIFPVAAAVCGERSRNVFIANVDIFIFEHYVAMEMVRAARAINEE